MKTFQKYKEENGLGDIKPSIGVDDQTIGELTSLLREHGDSLRRILYKALEFCNHDETNNIKKLIGLISNLRDRPAEKKKHLRDPMDNVVVRNYDADSSNSDGNSGNQ